jgi:hypothetical protein
VHHHRHKKERGERKKMNNEELFSHCVEMFISLVVFFLSKDELVDGGEQSDTPSSCVVLPLKSSSLQMTDHVE